MTAAKLPQGGQPVALAHTPGLLKVAFTDVRIRYTQELWAESGTVARTCDLSAGAPDANARRLVAGWNALDGLTDQEAQALAPGCVKGILDAAKAVFRMVAQGWIPPEKYGPRATEAWDAACDAYRQAKATTDLGAALAAAEGAAKALPPRAKATPTEVRQYLKLLATAVDVAIAQIDLEMRRPGSPPDRAFNLEKITNHLHLLHLTNNQAWRFGLNEPTRTSKGDPDYQAHLQAGYEPHETAGRNCP